MYDKEPQDAKEALVGFLRALPATIRAEVALFVILYAMQYKPPERADDYEPVVWDYLSGSGVKGTSAVICSVAAIDFAIDYSLTRLDGAARALKSLAAESPGRFEVSFLAMPLRRRQWEKAASSWRQLRQTTLSPQALLEYGDEQLSAAGATGQPSGSNT